VKNLALVLLVVSSVYLGATASARAGTAEPAAPPPTPSVDGAAGARGEETYFPGPGGGELGTQEALPLESTGLEDGPGGCKCASALGSRSNRGAGWLALGLVLVGTTRRSIRACNLLRR
jgi:hypothetical protein